MNQKLIIRIQFQKIKEFIAMIDWKEEKRKMEENPNVDLTRVRIIEELEKLRNDTKNNKNKR